MIKKDYHKMQLQINDGIIYNIKSLVMRVKRLEDIVNTLPDYIFNEEETPTGLGLDDKGKRFDIN